jgi:LuxR family transcriptional regulator of csgAB operon
MYFGSIVYILGPDKIYNVALQYMINKDLKMYCDIIHDHDWNDISLNLVDSSTPSMLLFDYQGNSDHNLLVEITTNLSDQILPDNIFMVMYNVQRESGIEESILKCGMQGIFYEDDSMELIKKGIFAVLNGELWFSRQVLSNIVKLRKENSQEQNNHIPNLTSREKEILIKIAQGKSNEEISKDFCISKSTVKTHIYKIYQKIDVPNRIQATLWSLKHLIIS